MTTDAPQRFHRRLIKKFSAKEPIAQEERHYSSGERFRLALVDELPRLKAHALVLTNDPIEADDLVQTTYEKSMKRWKQFNGSGPLAGWLYRIMQNTWRDTIRSTAIRRTEPLPEEISAREATPDEHVMLDRTREAIAILPPEQRATLLLVAVEGFTYTEAAAMLDVPIGTIRSRVSRARANLVEILDSEPSVSL